MDENISLLKFSFILLSVLCTPIIILAGVILITCPW